MQFVRDLHRIPGPEQHRDFVGHRLRALHRHHVQQLPAGRRQVADHPLPSTKGSQENELLLSLMKSLNLRYPPPPAGKDRS